jgi:hypothetical protein
MMTSRFVAELTNVVRCLRPDWHRAGIVAALRASTHSPADTAQAMLRRAANPANRTPALQPADYTDQPTVMCRQRGAWPHGTCTGCALDTGLVHDPADGCWPAFTVRTGEPA